MADLLPIDIQDMIAEVDREVRLRQQVYANRVGKKQMRPEVAERHIAVMQAVGDFLRRHKGPCP